MADSAPGRTDRPGLTVELRRDLRIGSLRYFDAAGPLDSALRAVIGGPLPSTLKAVRYSIATSQDEMILAWRSPTETVLLTRNADAFETVAATAAQWADAGCWVEQTGGLWAWQASGERTGDLIARMGSAASVPALGESRVSRVAELPVLILCVREGQVMMLAERVYSDHLLGWIRETAADL